MSRIRSDAKACHALRLEKKCQGLSFSRGLRRAFEAAPEEYQGSALFSLFMFNKLNRADPCGLRRKRRSGKPSRRIHVSASRGKPSRRIHASASRVSGKLKVERESV